MKLIAKNSVNLAFYEGEAKPENIRRRLVAPGEEFEIADTKEAEALIQTGAAARKTRAVADDGDQGSGDPATDTSLPASGSTTAPDPDAVGAAAKTAKRP